MRLIVPSERNFAIFHAVVTDRLSRREAAARFGISPTRVQQIVAHVQQFVLKYGDEELLVAPPEILEVGMLRLCYSKLTYFETVLMRSRHAVLKDQSNPVASLSASVRLLQAAARMSIDKTKVAARLAKAQLAMIEAGTLSRDELAGVEVICEDEETEELPSGSNASPVGGCTVSPPARDEKLLAALQPATATLDEDTSSRMIEAALARRKRLRAG